MGELELGFQALTVPDDSGQRILTYSALPGSPAAAALRLLHHPL